jgi:hypothetical protein
MSSEEFNEGCKLFSRYSNIISPKEDPGFTAAFVKALIDGILQEGLAVFGQSRGGG